MRPIYGVICYKLFSLSQSYNNNKYEMTVGHANKLVIGQYIYEIIRGYMHAANVYHMRVCIRE